ncbi:hypothetical protein FIU97_10950 [Roseivivax sp. THAF40]|nr:hypothetical protein FIV09_10965 [Roseivivax sp. THAF197b]QFT47091.1 hypothetical protein FIU97_10950 [Roseivivax sp. THAF40]
MNGSFLRMTGGEMFGCRRRALAILLGLAFVLPDRGAHAQNADSSQAGDIQRVGEFFERFDEHGRVSGDIVMGVMIGALVARQSNEEGQGDDAGQGSDAEQRSDTPLADGVERTTAHVAVEYLPQGQARAGQPSGDEQQDARWHVCVRINSKDGRFEAENTYSIANEVTAPEDPFLYDGDYEEDVTKTAAVSLVKVGRCGDRTELVVPSVWYGGPTPDEKALHVFVNSAGNPTGVIVGTDQAFVPCEDVAETDTLKYTASCILPFPDLKAQAEDGRVKLTFFVTRSLGEDEHDITVILPDEGR